MRQQKNCFVTENERLLGSITDGDIRRWILQNGNLEQPVMYVMNDKPILFI